jgi:cytochrome d ubiquinol oxidase subunit I
MLSYLSFGSTSAEIKGLETIPEKDWPRVSTVFQTYHLMIAMWSIMMFLSMIGAFLWWRGALFNNKWVLRGYVLAVLCPQIANQAGWVSAEMGRYPWIVYGLLRISDGLSKSVVASQVLSSLILFSTLYLMLFLVFLYLLNEKIKHGPDGFDPGAPYHQIKKVVTEASHESHV